MTIPATRFYRTIPDHPTVKLLPPGAQVLLAALYWHLNSQTGQLNPRHETLARELKTSVSSIRRHFRSLREAGIVGASRRRRAWGYAIQPVEEWRPITRCGSPRSTSRVVNPDYSKTESQESASLMNERQSSLNKKTKPAAAETGSSSVGDGGSPAGQSNEGRKNPERPVHRHTTETRPKPATTHFPTTDEARPVIQELLPDHPIAGNCERAVDELAKVMAEERGVPERIRTSHAAYRRMWASYQPGRFIPQLWRWIRDNDWRYPPTDEQIKASTPAPGKDPRAQAERDRERERESNRARLEDLQDDINRFPWTFDKHIAEVRQLRKWFEEHPA